MATWLTAHSFAYLRIAESVTVSGARLATGRAGSPLAGRVSHPLDDKQGFMKSSHTPILLDQPCLVASRRASRWRPCGYRPIGSSRSEGVCLGASHASVDWMLECRCLDCVEHRHRSRSAPHRPARRDRPAGRDARATRVPASRACGDEAFWVVSRLMDSSRLPRVRG